MGMGIIARDPDAGAEPAADWPLEEYGFVPDPDREYTTAEVRALNAANPLFTPRFECVDGVLLVTPAPTGGHQTAGERLFYRLTAYCEAHFPDGVPGLPPCDINWGKREKLMQPDVYVAPRAMRRAVNAARSSVKGWRQITHLLLVVEVLSPKTASADRGIKRRAYQQEGVPVYWIVDERARAVEVWTPDATGARVERERLVWHPEGAAVSFELAPAELFRPV